MPITSSEINIQTPEGVTYKAPTVIKSSWHQLCHCTLVVYCYNHQVRVLSSCHFWSASSSGWYRKRIITRFQCRSLNDCKKTCTHTHTHTHTHCWFKWAVFIERFNRPLIGSYTVALWIVANDTLSDDWWHLCLFMWCLCVCLLCHITLQSC